MQVRPSTRCASHARRGALATTLRFIVLYAFALCVTAQSWTTSSLAGTGAAGSTDGLGSSATFSSPSDISLSTDRTKLYVADTGSGKIRRIDVPTRIVESLPTNLPGNCPGSLDVHTMNTLVVSSACNHSVALVDLNTGGVRMLVGGVRTGYMDGANAMFNAPRQESLCYFDEDDAIFVVFLPVYLCMEKIVLCVWFQSRGERSCLRAEECAFSFLLLLFLAELIQQS